MSGYAIRTNDRGGRRVIDIANTGRKTQAGKRDFDTYTDQFDREWGGIIEKASLAPTHVRPLFHVNHPILEPPSKFVVHAPKGDRRRVHIDLEGWEAECRAGWAERAELTRKFAGAMYGNAAGEMIKNPPPELREMLGVEPLMKPEVIQAMRAKNPWALSLTDEKPPGAEQFLPSPEQMRAAKSRAPLPEAVDPFADLEPLVSVTEIPEPEEADEPEPEKTFPHHKGFGTWEFSDGTEERMTKGKAQRRQAELDGKTTEPAYEGLPT